MRPGVVLGPREYVGRLPWWLNRVAAGGRVLAPGSPDRSIQPVDVGDLAEFAVRSEGHGIGGAYNVTAPVGRETFGRMVDTCSRVTGSAFVNALADSLSASEVAEALDLVADGGLADDVACPEVFCT
jgi:nucleoside-diphosphate-sugar epimerase